MSNLSMRLEDLVRENPDATLADAIRNLWRDAKTDPPTESGFYDTCFWHPKTETYIRLYKVVYSAQHKLWNCFDGYYSEEVLKEKREHPFEVDYWMFPLPTPESPIREAAE